MFPSVMPGIIFLRRSVVPCPEWWFLELISPMGVGQLWAGSGSPCNEMWQRAWPAHRAWVHGGQLGNSPLPVLALTFKNVQCFVVTRSLLWLIIAMKQTPRPAVAAVLCKVRLFGVLLVVGSAV